MGKGKRLRGFRAIGVKQRALPKRPDRAAYTPAQVLDALQHRRVQRRAARTGS